MLNDSGKLFLESARFMSGYELKISHYEDIATTFSAVKYKAMSIHLIETRLVSYCFTPPQRMVGRDGDSLERMSDRIDASIHMDRRGFEEIGFKDFKKFNSAPEGFLSLLKDSVLKFDDDFLKNIS